MRLVRDGDGSGGGVGSKTDVQSSVGMMMLMEKIQQSSVVMNRSNFVIFRDFRRNL